jgi:hypothetical protein
LEHSSNYLVIVICIYFWGGAQRGVQVQDLYVVEHLVVAAEEEAPGGREFSLPLQNLWMMADVPMWLLPAMPWLYFN